MTFPVAEEPWQSMNSYHLYLSLSLNQSIKALLSLNFSVQSFYRQLFPSHVCTGGPQESVVRMTPSTCTAELKQSKIRGQSSISYRETILYTNSNSICSQNCCYAVAKLFYLVVRALWLLIGQMIPSASLYDILVSRFSLGPISVLVYMIYLLVLSSAREIPSFKKHQLTSHQQDG